MSQSFILLPALIQREVLALALNGNLTEVSELLLEYRSVCENDLKSRLLLFAGNNTKGTSRIPLLVQHDVRCLIAGGNLQQAAKLLLEFVSAFAPGRLDDTVLMLGAIDDFERERNLGRLDYSTLRQEKIRLSSGMLNFIGQLSDQDRGYLMSC